jgi:hypothetical protein
VTAVLLECTHTGVGICPNTVGSEDIDRAEETISRYDEQTDRKSTGGSQKITCLEINKVYFQT